MVATLLQCITFDDLTDQYTEQSIKDAPVGEEEPQETTMHSNICDNKQKREFLTESRQLLNVGEGVYCSKRYNRNLNINAGTNDSIYSNISRHLSKH